MTQWLSTHQVSALASRMRLNSTLFRDTGTYCRDIRMNFQKQRYHYCTFSLSVLCSQTLLCELNWRQELLEVSILWWKGKNLVPGKINIQVLPLLAANSYMETSGMAGKSWWPSHAWAFMLKRWESGLCHIDKICGKSRSRVGGMQTFEIGFSSCWKCSSPATHHELQDTLQGWKFWPIQSQKWCYSWKIAMSSLFKWKTRPFFPDMWVKICK